MRYSLLILSALLLMVSCTKTEQTKSREQILRDGKWQLQSGKVEYKKYRLIVNGRLFSNWIDSMVDIQIPECAADDYIIFRDGHEGAHISGDKTCNINETAEMDFTWGVSADDKQMYIYDGKSFFGSDVNANIIEFYDDKFGIRYMTITDNITVTDTAAGAPEQFVKDTTITTMYFKKMSGGGAQ